MKTSISKFESIFLTIGLFLISFNSNSQDVKLSREEQKVAKRDRDYFNFQVIDSMLVNKSFVIEADYLENQYGNRRLVSSNVNFIMVDSLRAVLQTGSFASTGTNGVGGATAEGSISGLKITKDLKNLSFFVRFTVNSNIGIYDVSMTIGSNRLARATITGLSYGKLIYDGRIETLLNSGVFKGRNTI
jgi:hypothetical protein